MDITAIRKMHRRIVDVYRDYFQDAENDPEARQGWSDNSFFLTHSPCAITVKYGQNREIGESRADIEEDVAHFNQYVNAQASTLHVAIAQEIR
jgi:hypothetical protein